QAVLVGAAGWEHLVVVAIVDGHGDVQIGRVAQRVATVVNLALHAEAVGQLRYLDERRDAAGHHHIPAQHVRGALKYPGGHAVEAARHVLRGEDGDVQVGGKLHVAVDVVLGQRVLVPEGLQV